MPYPSATYINQIVDPATRAEFEQQDALFQGYLSQQHKEDGSHGAITADSVTSTGDISTAGNLTVQSGSNTAKAELGQTVIAIGNGQNLNGLLLGGTGNGWGLHVGTVESPGSGTGSITQLEFISFTNIGGTPMQARALRLFYDVAAATYALEPIIAASVNLGSDGSGHRFGSIYADGVLKAVNDIYSVPWTDYSATSSIAGFSAFSTKQIFYKRVGKTVRVAYTLIGTSNSTALTFTVPIAAAAGGIDINSMPAYQMDNGTYVTSPGFAQLPAGSTTVTIFTNGGGAWTAANGKRASGQFFYETA